MNDYPQADNELIQQVWNVMRYRAGYLHRIDRAELTRRVFGKATESNDRKIRDALSELPVVWNDGYFVPTSPREAQGYIASMKSRQAAIGKRLRVLEDYLKEENEPVKVHQPILISF